MTFKIALDPTTGLELTLKLYQNVSNVPELRQKLIKGELKCCIIKPSLIVDPFQIAVAANKAATQKTTTTKSIYTEILFNLSISKNITQSLVKFGVDDKDTSILVATVDRNGEDEGIFSQIKGQETDLTELEKLKDLELIKKTYKVSDEELKVCKIVDSIVSRIAVKDFVSV